MGDIKSAFPPPFVAVTGFPRKICAKAVMASQTRFVLYISVLTQAQGALNQGCFHSTSPWGNQRGDGKERTNFRNGGGVSSSWDGSMPDATSFVGGEGKKD